MAKASSKKGVIEKVVETVVEAVTHHSDAPVSQEAKTDAPKASAKQAKESVSDFRGHPKFDKFGGQP